MATIWPAPKLFDGMESDLMGPDCPTHGGIHEAAQCPEARADEAANAAAGTRAPWASNEAGRLRDFKAIHSFVLAGNAVFTLVSRKTGTRFTYKVRTPDEKRPGDSVHFVAVLNGPDNWTNYAFLGTIFGGKRFTIGRNPRISPDAPSAKAITWFLGLLLEAGANPTAHTVSGVDFYHAGKCGRCGRRLTVPESITTGFGPECAGIMVAR